MEAVKVERGVPLPSSERPTKYPWSGLQVGDSFLVPYEGRQPWQVQCSVLSCASGWCRRRGLPWSFTTRQLPEGVRVWRVE